MSFSEQQTKPRTPGLWAVAGLGMIWNIAGALNLFMQMNAGMLASMPAEQRAIVEARPAWATVAFGVGVLAGAAGCALLLWRKRSAFPVLAMSLAAIALHMVSYFGIAGGGVAFGAAQWVLYAILPLARLHSWLGMRGGQGERSKNSELAVLA